MSDHWLIRPEIPKKDLEAKVKEIGWVIGSNEGEEGQWLHDGTSYIHLDEYNGQISGFWRYGIQNTMYDMIAMFETQFNTECIIEHDERYWEIIEEEEKK